jgi:N-acetylneuraminic acid mutarotase
MNRLPIRKPQTFRKPKGDHMNIRGPQRLYIIRSSRVWGVVAAVLWLAQPMTARAHFLWLLAEKNGDAVELHAFLNEQPVPDLPEFMRHIENAKITIAGKPVTWSKTENRFLVPLPAEKPAEVDGWCDLGVMTRGPATFHLVYTARAQFTLPDADAKEALDGLRLRGVSRTAGKSDILVTFNGKPAPEAVVKVYPEQGDPVEIKTDAEGRLACEGVVEGKSALLAKWIEPGAGESNGKAFTETRHYATLTVAPGAAASVAQAQPFATLPDAVNSFGGAVLGNWLYVYSGHTGQTHKYHTGTTLPHFRRLNLKDGKTWEELPMGKALQGVALVAHGGYLYRTGGMAAHNAEGEKHDLCSVDDVARFDPETRAWSEMPPLPRPRSTHDAAVEGDHLYVIGGWHMKGADGGKAEFLTDAYRLDLTDPSARWEVLSTPTFERRALTVAAHAGRLYVLGGLTDGMSVSDEVDIYDPKTNTWSQGPDLPPPAKNWFAASAFDVDGTLYICGLSGDIQRLDESGTGWEPVGRMSTPRLTHRMLAGIDNDLLIVGGTVKQAPTDSIEVFKLGAVSKTEAIASGQ